MVVVEERVVFDDLCLLQTYIGIVGNSHVMVNNDVSCLIGMFPHLVS
jgi:hypothetical protein